MNSFHYAPPQDPLTIIHQDDDLLLVDKPAGLLSVPGKAAEHADCLETRVKTAYPTALLVHRLDMDTSGIMVFAMNKPAQRHLGLQFERRHIDKTYIAEVFGKVKEDEGEVKLPLIVDWPNRPLQKVCFDTGKAAQTVWQVVGRADLRTRVRLTPRTGRSHQLRVHMRELEHPILGDRFYSSGDALKAADRLMLHSESLSFYHPTGGARVKFQSPCPF
ncbi:MAG: tRNA pseudouridine32 synthase/23S rRNA pseudouridine746 synthase [Paracoccaceae bacterium]|jgi:tRNA pseudouridine32 synthase/23S rRNA pseudouridine746 synthase